MIVVILGGKQLRNVSRSQGPIHEKEVGTGVLLREGSCPL